MKLYGELSINITVILFTLLIPTFGVAGAVDGYPNNIWELQNHFLRGEIIEEYVLEKIYKPNLQNLNGKDIDDLINKNTQAKMGKTAPAFDYQYEDGEILTALSIKTIAQHKVKFTRRSFLNHLLNIADDFQKKYHDNYVAEDHSNKLGTPLKNLGFVHDKFILDVRVSPGLLDMYSSDEITSIMKMMSNDKHILKNSGFEVRLAELDGADVINSLLAKARIGEIGSSENFFEQISQQLEKTLFLPLRPVVKETDSRSLRNQGDMVNSYIDFCKKKLVNCVINGSGFNDKTFQFLLVDTAAQIVENFLKKHGPEVFTADEIALIMKVEKSSAVLSSPELAKKFNVIKVKMQKLPLIKGLSRTVALSITTGLVFDILKNKIDNPNFDLKKYLSSKKCAVNLINIAQGIVLNALMPGYGLIAYEFVKQTYLMLKNSKIEKLQKGLEDRQRLRESFWSTLDLVELQMLADHINSDKKLSSSSVDFFENVILGHWRSIKVLEKRQENITAYIAQRRSLYRALEKQHYAGQLLDMLVREGWLEYRLKSAELAEKPVGGVFMDVNLSGKNPSANLVAKGQYEGRVSLKKWLSLTANAIATGSSLPEDVLYFGKIGRVLGYEITADDIILLVKENRKGKPLAITSLITALRQVYINGTAPRCSLDPDPMDFSGPQRVRVIGVPMQSEFAYIMLEADYLMKSLMLFGSHKVDFQSFWDLLMTNLGNIQRQANRFWMCPTFNFEEDVRISNDGKHVEFDLSVQVLTEQMMATALGLQPLGKTDSLAEQAAEIFSQKLPLIAEKEHNQSGRYVFLELQSLFDMVVLFRLLRHLDVSHEVLAGLNELFDIENLENAKVPSYYRGLARSQQSGKRFVSLQGGVDTIINEKEISKTYQITSEAGRSLGDLFFRASLTDGEKNYRNSVQLLSLVQESKMQEFKAHCQDVLRKAKGSGKVLLNIAKCYMYLEDYDQAAKILSRSIGALRRTKPVNNSLLAQALSLAGYVHLLRHGMFDSKVLDKAEAGLVVLQRSISYANQAKELNPDDIHIYESEILARYLKIKLFNVMGGGGDVTRAIGKATQMIDRFPNFDTGYAYRALLHYTGHNTSEAQKDFRTAIAINESSALATIVSGLINIRHKQWRQGCLDLSRAASIEPRWGTLVKQEMRKCANNYH